HFTGGCCGSHHELLAELVEAGPTAKEYDAVAGFERLVAAGGELDTTVGSLDGHHHDAGAAADVGVAECLASEWAIDADRDVIHLDGQAGSLGDQLDEFHGRRVGEQRDDAVGADDGRHDHVVGPGLPELFLGGGLLGPGDDQEIGGELSRSERDEDAGGVVGQAEQGREGRTARVSVMKTLAASLGMAVTSTHARSIPAFSRTASSVASPTRCKNPRASIFGTRFASSSMITNGSAELASPSQ